ncbi:Mpo1-like protein [Glaciimonas soli]|uniref:DUF962 domain-containing protein n=1 Tax=Glaciimonas soli TaxID=2590999 RepID=A0A843YW02_9BURK|nr:Mpo1-like protein [Glaciimonas soli]MQR01678.1 DUF962 domain-containing protein [Glaciimonas soli]
MPTTDERKYTSFTEFYPFYLSQHSNRMCRRLHFIGSTLTLLSLIAWISGSGNLWLFAALVSGYGCAWIGHFVFEKNRPATFKQPVFSLMGDWVMYGQMLTGKVTF